MVQQGKSWSFAHILRVLGFLLSGASLLWQMSIYRDSFKERVLVRLTAIEVLNQILHCGVGKDTERRRAAVLVTL